MLSPTGRFIRLSAQLYNVFVVSHRRKDGGATVRYLPDGKVVGLEGGVLLSRAGNHVIVQAGREKHVVEAPASLNLTLLLLRFVPLEAVLQAFTGKDPLEVLTRLESAAWGAEMSERARRFLRLYASLYGLKVLDSVPQSCRDAVVLAVSRLSGEPVERLVAEREELERKWRRELEGVLEGLEQGELAAALAALQLMDASTSFV